jgi:hypothetical protein
MDSRESSRNVSEYIRKHAREVIAGGLLVGGVIFEVGVRQGEDVSLVLQGIDKFANSYLRSQECKSESLEGNLRPQVNEECTRSFGRRFVHP